MALSQLQTKQQIATTKEFSSDLQAALDWLCSFI